MVDLAALSRRRRFPSGQGIVAPAVARLHAERRGFLPQKDATWLE
jgi:hypothetical protein